MKRSGRIFCLACLAGLLFGVAWGVRVAYQRESVVNNPIRGDAYSYYQRARAIEGADGVGEAKKARFIALAPTYPYFISLCMRGPDDDPRTVVESVTKVQAFLGATTALLVFLTGLLFLPAGWAFAAGMLTALNPHLIAMDGFILAESLFTWATMLGVFLFSCAWRLKSWTFALAGTAVIAFSSTIRSLNVLLFAGLMIVWMISAYRQSLPAAKIWWRRAGFAAILISGVTCAYWLIQVADSSRGGKNLFTGATWTSIVQGAYPGYFRPGGKDWQDSAWRHDPEYRTIVNDAYKEWEIIRQRMAAEPGRYLAWFGGGKAIFTWRWDNIYNGDVYIYPMIRKGFEEHAGLTFIHWAMKVLHWPLFAAAWMLTVLFLLKGFRTGLPRIQSLWPVALTFFYAMAVLTVLSPLPRYSIPYRPVAALCAVTALFMIDRWLKARNGRNLAGIE